jgi:hypothetical protein
MNNKQFVAREKMRARQKDNSQFAEMTGPGMSESPDHPRGTGGAGGSPCKFRKREGGTEDKRIVHGMKCKCEDEDED